jgi:hypothetical protein
MEKHTIKKYGDITAKLYKNGLVELTATTQGTNTLTQTFKIPLPQALKAFKTFVDFRKNY